MSLLAPERHFGILWELDFNTSGYFQKNPDGSPVWVEWSETEFRSLDTTWDAGFYTVWHNSETGGFVLGEIGGDYLNPWDTELGVFDSPLVAMQYARKNMLVRAEAGRRFEAQIDEAMQESEAEEKAWMEWMNSQQEEE